MNSASRGLRPTVGLRRPERHSSRRRRPTPGASAPSKADFNRHRASGRRSACTPNEFGLQGPPVDGRPAPTEKARSASAKADARRVSAFEGRFQSAQSLRPAACTPNEFGLRWPPVDGRPAPTRKTLLASAKADARRVSALEGRFQSAQKPPANSRPARRMNSASRGLRPTVGLRRPGRRSLRRRRPTPGAQRLKRPISIGAEPSADSRPALTEESLFASAKADARRAAPLKADFNRHESLRPTVGLHAE